MKIFEWIKEFFVGRPVTKKDILRDRLRYCNIAGTGPENISNFWDGIEELKDQYYEKMSAGKLREWLGELSNEEGKGGVR